MKLAVVTETFHPFCGGSAKRYHEVLKRLVRAGYEVTLYTVRLSEDWKEEEIIDGIKVCRTKQVMSDFITEDGFRRLSKVLLFSLYSRLKVDEKYDVVELNHCPIIPVLAFWLKSRQPICVTFHEVWDFEWYNYVPKRIHAPIGIALERLYVRVPDMAVAVSDFTASRLIEILGVDESRVKVISNGVDLKAFENVHVEKDPNRIIYVGRLNPHKKVDWLIDSLCRLMKEFDDLRLDIVGDGPLRNFYMDYARRKGCISRVRFYGKVSDDLLVKLLKRAYIYVLPSIREGQSITVLEAMAAGTPQVIVSAVNNGAVNLINGSGSGLIAHPSPSSIAEKVKLLLEDRNLWLKLRSNGLNYAMQYSWDRTAEEYRRLYENMAVMK
ncbi:MAG: glycosyltransferase family 4 protein [Candidatus Bathyarchaeia archaeon]